MTTAPRLANPRRSLTLWQDTTRRLARDPLASPGTVAQDPKLGSHRYLLGSAGARYFEPLDLRCPYFNFGRLDGR